MNFQTILEELDKLYDSAEEPATEDAASEPDLEEGIFNSKKAQAKKNELIQKILPEFDSVNELMTEIALEVGELYEKLVQTSVHKKVKDNGDLHARVFQHMGQLPKKLEKMDLLPALTALINYIESFGLNTNTTKLENFCTIVRKLNSNKECKDIVKDLNKQAKTSLPRAIRDAYSLFEESFDADNATDELVENVDDEIEVVDDDSVDTAEDAVQLILECQNCGAITLMTEADVAVDEETGIANADTACQYCEASEGYKIVGTVAPYEPDGGEEVIEESIEVEAEEETDEVTEGIFGFGKKKKAAKNASNASSDDVERTVDFTVYNENGTTKFSRTFTELPGKMSAEDQFKAAFKSSGAYNEYKRSSNYADWQYKRESDPEDKNWDTKYRDKPARNHFVARDFHL